MKPTQITNGTQNRKPKKGEHIQFVIKKQADELLFNEVNKNKKTNYSYLNVE